ncbi:MerR family transcriptional regulator [Streptomyces sp. 891-h]|uniref:MerR family transcriptional regulator n=1 Tax=Streptomyces sp. 891-h TaxID=2720714 RepID=UPI001FAA972A|nr:MerR family transcriptional regulator [Streptomyces sp. 891-h]UNZ20555.1 MerR family transcriptional regulator [Streptomyces sp. 891-h]
MLEIKPQSASGAAAEPKARADAVPAEGLTIGEAARRTGVSVHTLRYYERAGLVVTPVDRTSGGRRRYRELDLKWIVVCTKLRATGMPIRGIRRYAELVAAGPGNEAERLALMEAHRADVLARLAETQENLKTIDRKIETYRKSVAKGDADRLWAPVEPGPG